MQSEVTGKSKMYCFKAIMCHVGALTATTHVGILFPIWYLMIVSLTVGLFK